MSEIGVLRRALGWILALLVFVSATVTAALSLGTYCLTVDAGDTRALAGRPADDRSSRSVDPAAR